MTRRFRLGHAVLELAAAVSPIPTSGRRRSRICTSRRRSGETAILHLVTGDGRIVIAERDEPAEQLKVVAPIGTGLPDFAGSVAKVLWLPWEPGEAEAMLGRHELPAFTPRSVVDRAAYLKELARTRRRGYARENEEYLVGVSAVSAPVINHEGRTIGTISVVGAKTRVGERLHELAEPVMDAAAQVSLRLGALGEGRWRSYPRASSSSRST